MKKNMFLISIVVTIALISIGLGGCDTYYQPDPTDPAVTTLGSNQSNDDQGNSQGGSDNQNPPTGMFTGPDIPMDQVMDNGWGEGFRVNGQPADRESFSSGMKKTNSGYSYESTPGTWYINPVCSSNYKHFYQNDAKPEYPGGVLCGPTCYMIAVQMIACEKMMCYPCNKEELGRIYTTLKQAGKFDSKGMYINDLQWYANNYCSFVQTSYMRTAERSQMKEYIEGTIKYGYPVIVTTQINGYNGSYAANDADKTNQTDKLYYIDPVGTVGHFILLVGIKINADGSGYVYYRDPLTKSAVLRSTSYTRLLDAMKANGSPYYYDAVAIMKKGKYVI